MLALFHRATFSPGLHSCCCSDVFGRAELIDGRSLIYRDPPIEKNPASLSKVTLTWLLTQETSAAGDAGGCREGSIRRQQKVKHRLGWWSCNNKCC